MFDDEDPDNTPIICPSCLNEDGCIAHIRQSMEVSSTSATFGELPLMEATITKIVCPNCGHEGSRDDFTTVDEQLAKQLHDLAEKARKRNFAVVFWHRSEMRSIVDDAGDTDDFQDKVTEFGEELIRQAEPADGDHN